MFNGNRRLTYFFGLESLNATNSIYALMPLKEWSVTKFCKSRRDALRIIGYGLSSVALSTCSSQLTRQRPNIIFLLTDDQRARTLSGSGHPVIRTPHLVALASEGMIFTQAFVSNPICAPSRTTFLTGQYERIHGIGFSSPWKLTERQWELTYPALLRKAGYYTGFIGKAT